MRCALRLISREQTPRGGPQAEGPTITAADTVELIPGLPFLRFPIGRAYLWHGDCGLTLIETSGPGPR